ncbi:potassium transporter Kup [Paraburkholderia metrosideri]|uniref:Probable potassium transport system protein Kup n=1 Tax=Paraburkholderia metrosideri TaxID=580937 RepID=A0ABM8P3E5_9BURK|nr:potassium transporter Kup [Paraburkholderia metrosideri]CAD6555377.1 Low affinity potassium transport system protein kup [Paraburkholderia metrosideri]
MESSSGPQAGAQATRHGSMAGLALGAIGIVFGDIGTSPLYTMSTVFDSGHGLVLNRFNVVGVVSLIIWALIIVVSLKYVTLIMRAHNHGEGGIMALLALASSSVMDRPRLRNGLLLAGVFGAALFYGDGVITPAISVLSAVEGLQVAEPQLKPYVVSIALVVLVGLFVVQRHGTAGIGAVFGPVMVLWFGVIAVAGLLNIGRAPGILDAFNPFIGLEFLMRNGWRAFVSLGAVVLALTGAEALYADMGHFGAPPIRLSWFALVLPALGLNYLGQGALLLTDPKAVDNPFFRLFPSMTLFPMVVLATVATVIASQAVISGAFSMTRQAMQLGFMPRMGIVYTSEREVGQIYVPAINWLLLIAVVAAVLGFGSSTALGSAYGIAVTGTMIITTVLTFYVVRYAWHYNWLLCVLATGFFFVIDFAFFSANLLKFVDGGWFPLLLGAIMFTVMSTWHRGRELMIEEASVHAGALPLASYLDTLFAKETIRVPGTAVFLAIDPDTVPHALINNLAHNHVLHERVLFVHVINREVPYVPSEQRVAITSLSRNCYGIVVSYGFKDEANLPQALRDCEPKGLVVDPAQVSYFLSHATVVATGGKGMPVWRERLFSVMAHNIGNLAAYFKLTANRVIELGSRVEI